MNKEILEARLQEIEGAIKNQDQIIAQAMANMNMLDGGKREVLHWLSIVNSQETEV